MREGLYLYKSLCSTCMCVRERGGEKEREGERERRWKGKGVRGWEREGGRKRERERECVCGRVCQGG